MMVSRKLLVGLIVALLTAGPAFAVVPYGTRAYQGPGIVVTQFNVGAGEVAVLDNGAVVCRASSDLTITGAGRGGACIPFDALHYPYPGAPKAADAIYLTDDDVYTDVAFQVCVDNNGDHLCTGSPDVSNGPLQVPPSCAYDTIAYSHETGKYPGVPVYHNPLYIPPWVHAFWQSCGGNGYPGYIVIVCAGFHDSELGNDPHTHHAIGGLATPVRQKNGDTYNGNFCGAPTATKAYVVL